MVWIACLLRCQQFRDYLFARSEAAVAHLPTGDLLVQHAPVHFVVVDDEHPQTAQIADGYARVDDGELWLYQTHVPPWRTGVGFSAHDPDRRRKLLGHRREVDELLGRTRAQPLTLIPLRLYFSDGKVKVELALAKGKRLYDRRQALAKRDAELDMARAVRGAERDGRLHRE